MPSSSSSPRFNLKAQSQKPTKNFLCSDSPESGANELFDAAANSGSAADFTSSIIAVGATAAGASRVTYPQATSFLVGELASGLSAIGQFGKSAAGFGIIFSAVTGDFQSALYGVGDYYVYAGLGSFGASSAVPTAGLGTAAAAGAALLYYNAGGSKGLVQSTICTHH
jgi:hypothetical protein